MDVKSKISIFKKIGKKSDVLVEPKRVIEPQCVVSKRANDDEAHDSKLQIPWSEIIINTTDISTCLLGRGSFGIVIRATWKRNNREKYVAVKFLAKSSMTLSRANTYDEACMKAWDEVELMKEAEQNLADSDCIVKAFGVCEGALPVNLCKLFNLPH